MEMTLNIGMFAPLSSNEVLEIDGGINWDRVFNGATVYLGATMTLFSLSGPIGWGVGATYIAICATSSTYICYGLAT